MAKRGRLVYHGGVFKLRILSRGPSLVYAASPLGKVLYLALLALLVWGMATQGGPFPVAAAVIAALCLAGVLYVEVWVFDSAAGEVRSFFGVWPFVRRSVHRFSDVECLSISHFTKGVSPAQEGHEAGGPPPRRRAGRRPMLTFALRLSGGAEVPIEIIEEGRSAGRTEADARAIAGLTGLRLVVDRPRDAGPLLRVSDIPRGFDKR